MEEENWDEEINSGTTSVKVDTRVWQPSNALSHGTGDFSRSRGRGFWNKSDSDENWRKPGNNNFVNRNYSFGRGSGQNNYRSGRTEEYGRNWSKDTRNERGFGRGVLREDDRYPDKDNTFGRGETAGRSKGDEQDTTVMTVPSGKVGRIIGVWSYRYKICITFFDVIFVQHPHYA